MLHLPDVTLVCIETREHQLMLMAIEDCLNKVEFGDVLIFTDRPLEFSSLTTSHGIHPRIQTVLDWNTKLEWCRFRWTEVAPHLRTSHALFTEWDAWIWDESLWTDEFLEYDYCGAPWWYTNGCNVGNGGFSLISTRLKRYIRDRSWTFSCDTSADDDLLCRKYRPSLEPRGFRWAPEKLAYQFSFECVRPLPTSRHFGFHGGFNFGVVLPKDRLIERIKIMLKSHYITQGKLWEVFMKNNGEVVDEILLQQANEIVKKEAKYG